MLEDIGEDLEEDEVAKAGRRAEELTLGFSKKVKKEDKSPKSLGAIPKVKKEEPKVEEKVRKKWWYEEELDKAPKEEEEKDGFKVYNVISWFPDADSVHYTKIACGKREGYG